MSSQTQSASRTRIRCCTLSRLTIGTKINYLDRTVLGIAAPSLTIDLEISATTMGIVFSAYSRTCAAMQMPGGIFLGRFGTKLTYFRSPPTLLHVVVSSNFAANLAGMFTPLGIGIIVAASGSFLAPPVFISVEALTGAFTDVFVVGDIRRRGRELIALPS